MKGFFKRDLYLVLLNAKFYVAFIVFMGIFVAVNEMAASFLNVYVAIFASSTLIGLFNYDLLGWMGYAMATPEGRKRQVQGRYALSLLVVAVAVAIILLLSLLLWGEGGLMGCVIFGAAMLVYVALLMPVSYKFGNKNRIVMVAIIGATAALFAAGGSAVIIGAIAGPLFRLGAALPAGMVAVALAALALSYYISLGIMERKEL